MKAPLSPAGRPLLSAKLSRQHKVKDFLINRKVPLAERDRLVLVLAGEEIIWAAGLEIAHPYRLTSGTRRALRLLYHISEE